MAAVLAMAPVAGIPPKHAEPILATPCATSSMLERCFDAIILSATTADKSDSIPANTAIVNAFESCDLIIEIENMSFVTENTGSLFESSG